ncbi:MAG: CopL family metal-binding regulatory protein [Moraxellaceae bacterium]
MSHHPFFRIVLMLALLLNGLSVAHAAVAHGLMQMPVAQSLMHESMPLHQSMENGAAMAMDDCHEMAEHAASDNASNDSGMADKAPHKAMACCQGAVCNCACALQMPISFSAIALQVHAQSVQAVALANSYRSIDLSRILRPPIA